MLFLPVAVLAFVLVFFIARRALTRRARAQGERTPASKVLLLTAVVVVVIIIGAVANIIQAASEGCVDVVGVVKLNHLASILVLSVIDVSLRLAMATVGR